MSCSSTDSKNCKICVVTGTRAEYGLLYWVIKTIHQDSSCDLQLVVTGSHLSPEFGMTVKEIEEDGFPVAERIEVLLSSDTETAVATSMGLALMGLAKAYERLEPDVLVVVGDRFEIFAAVAAAVPFRIPIAHIHGGESTEGAMDELFRHAITKMSHIHFPAAEGYARRIRQMGERPDAVRCVGALVSDNVRNLELLDKGAMADELEIPADRPWGLLTYHPVTLEPGSAEEEVREVLEALKRVPGIFWILTAPNADVEGRTILRRLESFASDHSGAARLFHSLGRLRYLSLLKWAGLMVGNSSSGIIEAPFFRLPVVNIGNRQKGRIRAGNVIDVVSCEAGEIERGIQQAMSAAFTDGLEGLENPYGGENVAQSIVDFLKAADLKAYASSKAFWDFPE